MRELCQTAGPVEGSIYESTTWKYNLCDDVYSLKIRLKWKKSFPSSSVKTNSSHLAQL